MRAEHIKRSVVAAAWLVLLLLTLTGCHRHKIEHLVYTDDYPTMYEAELRQIFGDYTLLIKDNSGELPLPQLTCSFLIRRKP